MNPGTLLILSILLFYIPAIFPPAANADSLSRMTAPLTGSVPNSNTGSCGIFCTTESLTNTYHVSCAVSGNPPYYVYDSINTATGENGLLKDCPGTITASVYNSNSTPYYNHFATIP